MSEKMDNLFILARRAKDSGDNAAAAKYYEQILFEDPNNWEAVFYTDYCTAASCVIRDIGPSAVRLKSAFNTAFTLIQNSGMDDKENLLATLCDETSNLLATLRTAAYNHYTQNLSVNGVDAEFNERAKQCGLAHLSMGDLFYNIGDKRIASICYKRAQNALTGVANINELALNRIKEYDPSYQIPKTKSGCYVATAVYGSYDCPQVWTLRRYRDNTLAETWYGRAFIRTYYAISPTLVKWFGNTQWFKNFCKGKLDRMVKKLQGDGVESTPYEDKNW